MRHACPILTCAAHSAPRFLKGFANYYTTLYGTLYNKYGLLSDKGGTKKPYFQSPGQMVTTLHFYGILFRS